MATQAKLYLVRIFYGDYAHGPSGPLTDHIFSLVKRMRLAGATVLKDRRNYDMFGKPAVERLLGGNSGSHPVIVEVPVLGNKLDAFIARLKELVMAGKSNAFYITHEAEAIIGNPDIIENSLAMRE
ncbi:MAG: DUF190 domain-containing protein [Cytophagales bacterium]|nr:DUF190 domain-containing protein [Cytophagales bacterium]